MAKVITAQQAAGFIKDGDTVVFAPNSLVGFPNEIVAATRERFLREGHPADITTLRAAGMGTFAEDEYGEGAWCLDGMLKRTISSYLSVCPILGGKVAEEKVQAYLFPLGSLLQLFKAKARGMSGVLTKIGLGTFMDARYGGGKCNRLTEEEGEDLVEYIPDFRGEEYLFYKSPGMDIALLRGTSADENGNISTEKEPIDVEMLSVAQAVKSSGGIVICQVEKLVGAKNIHPRQVKIPGIYVDYIVVAEHPESVPQTTGRWNAESYNYSFTGDEVVDLDGSIKPMPLDHKKVIARRAAMEITRGNKVNFGIGMPQNIPSILAECGHQDDVTMLSETGLIGGLPATGRDFGCHWNPEAFCDHGEHFSFFDGGNLDVGFFGLSEVDNEGNLNTSHLNGKLTGIGGFTNISTNSKKAVFLGTFTAVGLETEISDGMIRIKKEGKFRKFINKCEKISFVAKEYLKKHDSILFITERCVIRGTDRGLILEEVAPGIDIWEDIFKHCGSKLRVPSGGPKLMDRSLFYENGFSITL